MPTVRDIIDKKGSDVACVSKSDSVPDAVNIMADRRICAVVVKSGKKWSESLGRGMCSIERWPGSESPKSFLLERS